MTNQFQFEKALEDLEKIVTAMESGELTLDEALKKYEQGVQLVRACQTKLGEAEKKIEVLTKTLDGVFKKEAFDGDEGNVEKGKSRKKKNASKDAEGDEA